MKVTYGPLNREREVSAWAAQFLDEEPDEPVYEILEPETVEQLARVVPDEALTPRGEVVVAARLLACVALAVGFGWRPAFLISAGLGLAALALELTGSTWRPERAEA